MSKPQADQARKSYADQGEDLEVLAHFGDRPGVFVEAGANHPIIGSQTYLLERSGWTGVLIEPHPTLAELCRTQRTQSKVFRCALVEPGGPEHVRMRIPGEHTPAQASITRVETKNHNEDEFFDAPARTLDAVLEDSGIESIDFFSIDLEGYEPQALRGFNWARWQPRLLSVEDHCEDLETHRAVSRHGYKLVRRIGDNHWYVPAGTDFPVSFQDRLGLTRKLYLSLPIRKLRSMVKSRRQGVDTTG